MSYWTYINGSITVVPLGTIRDEKDTILDTVLANLPHVSGSEGGMRVYVVPKTIETLKVPNGREKRKPFNVPSEYILMVEGSLRDRHFDLTLREFTKWLCRLAKRVEVSHVLVAISDHNRTYIVDNNNCAYSNMYVEPSWLDDSSVNWCEQYFTKQSFR